jgi:hypothetical protein
MLYKQNKILLTVDILIFPSSFPAGDRTRL